jgi:WS/DGAT/MGAT family acyltransferase
MNALETLFWRAENHPGMRSNMLGVLVLDRCPEWEWLVTRHEWASRVVPRLRQRVVEPPLRLGRPFWTIDRGFDVRDHLRRVRLPSPGTDRQLLDYAQSVAQAPFAPERPLWEVTLVEGLGPDGAGAAYLLKLHHSVSDGIGAAQLLTVLADPPRALGTGAENLLPPPPGPGRASPPVLLAGRLGRQLLRLPSAAGRVAGRFGKARAARTAPRPRPSVREVFRTLESFARTTIVPPVPASPLLSGRSRTVYFDTLEFPLDQIKAAGRAAGGLLNDAFVAGLMGGLHRYHQRFGLNLKAVPLIVPISVRRPRDLPAGNRLASTRLGMPVGGLGPAERVAEVRRQVAAVRTGPMLHALDLLSRPITPMPGPLVRFVFTQMFRGNDLIATNFPGVPVQLSLAGARVTDVWPFPPLLMGATSIAMVTYVDTCRLGITLDTGAFTAPEVFVTCLRESFGEILALAGQPRPATTPLSA